MDNLKRRAMARRHNKEKNNMEVATREIKQIESNFSNYLLNLKRICSISARRALKKQCTMYN